MKKRTKSSFQLSEFFFNTVGLNRCGFGTVHFTSLTRGSDTYPRLQFSVSIACVSFASTLSFAILSCWLSVPRLYFELGKENLKRECPKSQGSGERKKDTG